ncbi:PP2C family protein-serine/threonine phosphatase [Armatimonas sp.]|uniref:PP2C family protein-serine/threonine phosphatase n=1 Tax=Armatimonas sp. TaxID=1872638 RepID=UPI00375397AD
MQEKLTCMSVIAMSKRLRAAGGTDIGQKRRNNEDAYFIHADGHVFGVFDGMGGMTAGEVASRIACEQVSAFFTQERLDALDSANNETVLALLTAALCTADSAIRTCSQTSVGVHMGTTAVIAVRLGKTLHVMNLGDSRAYLLRVGEPLQKLTRDHTVGAVLVELKEITEEEAATSGARNRLLASLGDMGDNKPAYNKVDELLPTDRILLCSDGLWDMVNKESLTNILSGSQTPEEAVERLITNANANGGTDNITAIVIMMY